MKYKFQMYEWNGGEFKIIPTNKIVEAIYYAWNYECEVYDRETRQLIFAPFESNEFNSELLQKYNLRVIDHEGWRKLQNTTTDEIYEASWH